MVLSPSLLSLLSSASSLSPHSLLLFFPSHIPLQRSKKCWHPVLSLPLVLVHGCCCCCCSNFCCYFLMEQHRQQQQHHLHSYSVHQKAPLVHFRCCWMRQGILKFRNSISLLHLRGRIVCAALIWLYEILKNKMVYSVCACVSCMCCCTQPTFFLLSMCGVCGGGGGGGESTYH